MGQAKVVQSRKPGNTRVDTPGHAAPLGRDHIKDSRECQGGERQVVARQP